MPVRLDQDREPDIDEVRVAELIDAIGADGVEELWDAFIDDAALMLSELRVAMGCNDRERTLCILHTITGAASNIGYSALAALASSGSHEVQGTAFDAEMASSLKRLQVKRNNAGGEA